MPRIVLDFEPAQSVAPELTSDTSDLVYFLSWAFSTRYGANHELSLAALVLRGEHGIDLSPLLTFADARIEGSEEEAALEAMWQDAEPLAACARAVAGAIESGDELRELTADFPELPERLRELAAMADWAAAIGARVRLTYVL
jgi:hypothetical protein